MSVSKRGATFHYEFVRKGHRYRGTTGAKTTTKALEYERKFKDELYDLDDLGRTREMTFGEAVDNYTNTVLKSKKRKPDGSITDTTKSNLYRVQQLEVYFGPDSSIASVAAPAATSEFNRTLLNRIKPATFSVIGKNKRIKYSINPRSPMMSIKLKVNIISLGCRRINDFSEMRSLSVN